MLYDEIIPDLASLRGRTLHGISQENSFKLVSYDSDAHSWEIEDATGRRKRRSTREIEVLWAALQGGLPVHVDSALRGSGSSRNQPETVLANLPYVEWLRLGGKKHLAYVGQCTHHLGTLKQMDALAAQELQLRAKQRDGAPAYVLVSDDVSADVRLLSELGWQWESVEQGAYVSGRGRCSALVLDVALVRGAVVPGWYPLLSFPGLTGVSGVTVGDFRLEFTPLCNGWAALLR